jgi:hypothetical protein
MRYKIVTLDENGWHSTTAADREELEGLAITLGLTITGQHSSPRTRAELQGHPTFKELIGPMWDGDQVRYEGNSAYLALSA